jgi:hypothetical protein
MPPLRHQQLDRRDGLPLERATRRLAELAVRYARSVVQPLDGEQSHQPTCEHEPPRPTAQGTKDSGGKQ